MSTVAVAIKKWKLDINHTSIGFKIGHLGLASIYGFFNQYDGEVELENEGFEGAKIKITIEADSVNTGNDMRDNHLKTPEFIDAFSYPEITFESTSVTKAQGDFYEVKGNLTIKETTKEITLKATHPGMTNDMWGNTVAVFHLTGKINRLDFDVQWHNMLDNGLPVISEMVEFDMNIELIPEED